MKNRPFNLNKVITILIPIIIILFYIARSFFIELTEFLPSCPFYARFHLYCPACGNTRCIKALLSGNLLSALRYNASPVLFGIFLFLAYVEFAAYSFGRKLRLLPRKLSFYITLIILLVLYLIIRNYIPYLTP